MITDWVREHPKVVLHDHIDGGLRPATIIELAAHIGYDQLGTNDPADLAARIRTAAAARNLPGYLEAFTHTIAVLRDADALTRAATEAVCDLADDGVVYAEVRFAPELHDNPAFELDEVISAVCDGLGAGERAAAEAGRSITARLIVAALRDHNRSSEVARAAVADTSGLVVGFDLANNEIGHRASSHHDALRIAADGGLGITVHAGEADTSDAIADAIESGAARIGHGVAAAAGLALNGVARPYTVLETLVETGVPLEVCPTSNIDTGVCASYKTHPIDALYRAGATVTVNTDNRLMSNTTMSNELQRCVDTYGWGPAELHTVTANALAAAFCDDATRAQVARHLTR